jgi:phospholipid/cholesterol/gamma-HCH transport system permease protein
MNKMKENTARQESSLKVVKDGDSTIFLLRGRLDAGGGGMIWKEAVTLVEKEKLPRLILDGAGVTYCDVAGIGLLIDLKAHQEEQGGAFEIRNFPAKYFHLLELFPPSVIHDQGRVEHGRASLPEKVGAAAAGFGRNIRNTIGFIGELSAALFYSLTHPGKGMWKKCGAVMESAGVNAVPIILLLGFLIGLILAFQSAGPMAQYGAGIFVIDLVAITLIRELGPLITAIIVAGRSGSAFAAEIGTMKVNDEVNALITMGLNPVSYLAVPKVLAGILVMPLLTILTNVAGLIGAGLVVLSMGYPVITIVNRVINSVGLDDLLTGTGKTLVFGLLIAGIGCLRGLQTKAGAQSVGVSTTGAVVSGIIMIIISDGVFAVIFYYLGI